MDKQAAEIERMWKENRDLHQKVSELMNMVNSLKQQLAAKACGCMTGTFSQSISTLKFAQQEMISGNDIVLSSSSPLMLSSMVGDNDVNPVLVPEDRNQKEVGNGIKARKIESGEPSRKKRNYGSLHQNNQLYQPRHPYPRHSHQSPGHRSHYQKYPYQPPYQQPRQPYLSNRHFEPATNYLTSPSFHSVPISQPRPSPSTNHKKNHHPQNPKPHIDPLPTPYTYT